MTSQTKPILLAITMAVPGGATSFVFMLASWLKRQKKAVIVAAGEEGTWLEDCCREADIPFRRIPHLRRAINPFHDTLAVQAFAQLIREVQPSALHLNSSKAGVIGSLAGRITNVRKIVYCIGGWAALDAGNFLQRSMYTWSERLSSSWKDTIVCLHPGDKAFAETHHIQPKERLEVIPNGIDINSIQKNLLPKSEARRALRLSETEFIFGTIAHFYPAKDLPHYLRACVPFLKETPAAHLCLIGDGAERSEIETIIRENDLELSVTLAGAKDHAAQYLSAFDAFVLPSKKEGMPFVLLEAAAAQLPIIATDVGANAWMLPEAHIVSPGHSESLIQTMKDVVQHPALVDYTNSLSRFTKEACLSAHERLLETR